MARKQVRTAPAEFLNSTERQAIAKLRTMHRPILKEMEKWKAQREKLETQLLDHIGRIGKILKPYYEQSQDTLAKVTKQKVSTTRNANKKRPTKKKSTAKKSRSR